MDLFAEGGIAICQIIISHDSQMFHLNDGRFPVPVAPSVLLETVSFRQADPQTPNMADLSSCGHFLGLADKDRTNGLTGLGRSFRDGCDRKSPTYFSRHCCHRHCIRCIAGERISFGCQKRGCRVYPGWKCALQVSLTAHLGRSFLRFHAPAHAIQCPGLCSEAPHEGCSDLSASAQNWSPLHC